jgi:DNA repair protein RecO (recombination protein O)
MGLNEGIIVKTQIYQESSKIVWILTQDSLSSYLIRGCLNTKSHNYVYSQELTKIRFQVSEKSQNKFPIITNGEVLSNYTSIKTNIDKMKQAIIMLDTINQLGDHIDDKNTLYHFLALTLDYINQNYHPYYLQIFRIKLLYLLGIGPIFSKCVNCGSIVDGGSFDLYNGGMVCDDCKNSTLKYYDPDIVLIARFLYLTKMEYLPFDVVSKIPNYNSEVSAFVDAYYDHFLGFTSRAETIMKKL